jgi:hypothetical protein
MARGKSGSRLHGVPPDDEMRDARDDLRREAREMYDAWCREAYRNASPRPQGPCWGVSIGDTELAVDYAVLRDAVINTKRARALKPRKGAPTDIQTLRKAVDELDRAGIPLNVWKGSPAHWHIIDSLDLPDDASAGTKHGAAYSLLRRLGDLARRVGLRD